MLLPSLLSTSVRPSIVLFVVVYGLDWVATVPPTVALCREIFGESGTIVFGWVFASHQFGAAGAALAAGVVRDPTGSYTLAWVGGAGLCAVAAVLSWVRCGSPERQDAVRCSQRRCEEAEPVGARAAQVLDRVLGVRHQPDDVAALVGDAGDVAQRAVGVDVDVAEDHAALALQPVERVGVGDEPALAVLERDQDLLADVGTTTSTPSTRSRPGASGRGR